jgi:hypothetical protein
MANSKRKPRFRPQFDQMIGNHAELNLKSWRSYSCGEAKAIRESRAHAAPLESRIPLLFFDTASSLSRWISRARAHARIHFKVHGCMQEVTVAPRDLAYVRGSQGSGICALRGGFHPRINICILPLSRYKRQGLIILPVFRTLEIPFPTTHLHLCFLNSYSS